jgi:hypothetical protein
MMNKILRWLLVLLLVAIPCFGAQDFFFLGTSHTGGGDNALDSVNGTTLSDGYKAIIVTATNTYFYTLDADSAASEEATSYTVISPDNNAGDKRWVLETVVYDFASTTLANDATPSVANENFFLTGGTTTITDFDDGITGQVITVVAEHSLTITDGTNIFLNGSSNFAMTATDTLTLRCKADNKWYEVSRADSGA